MQSINELAQALDDRGFDCSEDLSALGGSTPGSIAGFEADAGRCVARAYGGDLMELYVFDLDTDLDDVLNLALPDLHDSPAAAIVSAANWFILTEYAETAEALAAKTAAQETGLD